LHYIHLTGVGVRTWIFIIRGEDDTKLSAIGED